MNNIYARQAISTTFVGPTNLRGSRISAVTEGGHRMMVNWDHALSPQQNHAAAALALARKLGWRGSMCMGATRNAYVFVFVEDNTCMEVSP